MKGSFWTPYISDHSIHAICWTLIHSLWIGLAIALLAGLVILLTRRSAAALRYNLLCSILVLFSLSVGLTFYLQMRTPATDEGAVKVGQFINGQVKENLIIIQAGAQHFSFIDRVVMLLNEYSNVIFLAWLLLFVLKSLKMAGGLLYIQRIRNYKVHEVSDEFKDKIKSFADQIGIKRTVSLMQSELVKVPVAVGWLKPMILLPMGIIFQLTPEQLESILWHELAHIRRRDYLVNILQGLVETVFFFNPGLLWLSSLIRAEREACCDDMVLSRTNRKANYLEALLAFGNKDNSRMPLAMSIGSGNQLRDRLKRMVNKENKRLSMAEKVVLIAGLVVLSAFTGLPKTTHQAVKKLISVITKKKDTTAAPKQAMLKPGLNKLALSTKYTTVTGDTTKKVDTSIRFNSIVFTENDADLANCDLKAQGTDGNIYHLTIYNNELIAVSVNDKKVDELQLPEYEFMVKRIRQAIDEKRTVTMKNLEVAKAKLPAAKFKKNGNFDKKRYADSAYVKDYYGDSKAKAWKTDSFGKGGEIVIRGVNPRASKSVTLFKRLGDDSSSYAEERGRALRVIADLVADKVVPNAGAVKWFGLSNTEFIVNGNKQPAEMQQRYKAKYGIHENYGLYYGPVEMTGTGVFINDDARVKYIRQMNARRDMEGQRMKIMHPRMKQPGFGPLDSVKIAQQAGLFKIDGKPDRAFKRFKPGVSISDMIASVTDDLVSENILKDKGDLTSFKLTNSFLVVNGRQQPEEVHQRLRSKYLASPKYSLNPQAVSDPHFGLQYNAKTGSMGLGITIDRDDPAVK
ncbi:MAG: M56 family metallopeptidase [Bacteroidetes bacterium]|nr:M56 family metallopeptidase [Bacteroidota bacterium]